MDPTPTQTPEPAAPEPAKAQTPPAPSNPPTTPQAPTSKGGLLDTPLINEDGRPDWCPENLWDKDTKTVKQDALYKQFRDTQSAFNKLQDKVKGIPEVDDPAPEQTYFSDKDVDEEGFLIVKNAPEGLEKIKKDEPFLVQFMQDCKEVGMGQRRFEQLLPKMLATYQRMTAPSPVDIEAELTLLDNGVPGRGRQIATAVQQWLTGLETQGTFTPDEASFLRQVGATAFSMQIIEKFMNLTGQKSIPTGRDFFSSSGVTKADWQKAVTSKEYMTSPEFRNKWDAIGAEFFPG